jgi:hypothetical protein
VVGFKKDREDDGTFCFKKSRSDPFGAERAIINVSLKVSLGLLPNSRNRRGAMVFSIFTEIRNPGSGYIRIRVVGTLHPGSGYIFFRRSMCKGHRPISAGALAMETSHGSC